jgi:hypothetical protein
VGERKEQEMTERKRNYTEEYKAYHSKPEQIANRSQRNKARREMEDAGKVRKGDGKDVDHKTPIKSGGGNGKSNLRVTSQTENRGWRKGKSGYNP